MLRQPVLRFWDLDMHGKLGLDLPESDVCPVVVFLHLVMLPAFLRFAFSRVTVVFSELYDSCKALSTS